MSEGLILIIIVLVGALALVMGVAAYFLLAYLQPEPSTLQLRLAEMKSQYQHEKHGKSRKRAEQLDKLVKASQYSNKKWESFVSAHPQLSKLSRLLQQAGINDPIDKHLLRWFILPSVILLAGGLAIGNPILILLGVLSPGASIMRLKWMKGKREHKFLSQLPDALGMITNALRAGHSLQSALSLVSLEFKDPIGTEFSQLTNDINLGIPMKDALERMANTMESVTDLRLFTTAVMINREAGGNLAEVLEKLGYTIRDRFKFKGHLKAITGQSRLTGYVIGLMPLFLGLIFSVISPGYTDPLFDTVLGLILLVAAIGMEILGMFIIGKIVNIRY